MCEPFVRLSLRRLLELAVFFVIYWSVVELIFDRSGTSATNLQMEVPMSDRCLLTGPECLKAYVGTSLVGFATAVGL